MRALKGAQLNFDRRTFLLGGGAVSALALSGCATTSRQIPVSDRQEPDTADYRAEVSVQGAQLYAAKPDEPYPLPAIPYQKISPKFYRQMVADPTGQPPGTLVVDTGNHFLYYTYPNGQAMRYGVGLGRAGFAWSGRGVIQYKRRWPKWTPPAEMVARQPELQQKVGLDGSMEPGLTNPLGARAMYIFHDGEDTLFRVHGSPEWWTIGKNVSSGCVRMINQDICDLFDRVSNKTPIVVTNLSGGYDEAQSSDQPREQMPRYENEGRLYDPGLGYEQGLGDDPIYYDPDDPTRDGY